MDTVIQESNKLLAAQEQTLNIELYGRELKCKDAKSLINDLNETMNKYKQLKLIVKRQQVKLFLFEALGDNSRLNEQTIHEELKVAKSECKEVKNAVESHQENIEELSDRIEALVTAYRQKYKELRQWYDTVSLQKEEFAIRLVDDAELQDKTTAESHSLMLERVSCELVHMKKLQEDWFLEVENLRKERNQQTQSLAQLHKQQTESHMTDLSQPHHRLRRDLNQLKGISGVREHSWIGNKLTFELWDPSDSECLPQVLLTVNFEWDEHFNAEVTSAQVNVSDLDISDILQNSMMNNDVYHLVIMVRSLWLMRRQLIQEIEQLRQKYALDWRCREGIVQVLYDNVVCDLKVESTYPEAGSLHLTAVSMYQSQLMALQPGAEVTSLSDWLQYLQHQIQQVV